MKIEYIHRGLIHYGYFSTLKLLIFVARKILLSCITMWFKLQLNTEGTLWIISLKILSYVAFILDLSKSIIFILDFFVREFLNIPIKLKIPIFDVIRFSWSSWLPTSASFYFTLKRLTEMKRQMNNELVISLNISCL